MEREREGERKRKKKKRKSGADRQTDYGCVYLPLQLSVHRLSTHVCIYSIICVSVCLPMYAHV